MTCILSSCVSQGQGEAVHTEMLASHVLMDEQLAAILQQQM